MNDICTGVTLTDTCGNEATHVVEINAPTGYREVTHCKDCAERRAKRPYCRTPRPLEGDA